MTSIHAYYDGHNYITQGNVAVKENQRVIITLLDDFLPRRNKRTLEEIKGYMHGGKRLIPDGISTLDYIRQLREE